MTVSFKLKRTSVSGRAPDTASIDYGELAVNTFDGVIYFKKNDGNGDAIVPISQVTEYNFPIDNVSLSNTVSNNLSGVLKDLDTAITSNQAANTSLTDLSDVSALSPQNGQALIWNGSAWTAQTVSGGGGALTLDGLLDVSVASPSAGQVLKYNGAEWTAQDGGSNTVVDTTTVQNDDDIFVIAMIFG